MDRRAASTNRREVPASDDYSLALGRAVARKLATDRATVKAIAWRNLTRARAQHREGPSWLRQWEDLLSGPEDELPDVLTSSDAQARVLRQTSPFAGVLTPQNAGRCSVRYERRDVRREPMAADLIPLDDPDEPSCPATARGIRLALSSIWPCMSF